MLVGSGLLGLFLEPFAAKRFENQVVEEFVKSLFWLEMIQSIPDDAKAAAAKDHAGEDLGPGAFQDDRHCLGLDLAAVCFRAATQTTVLVLQSAAALAGIVATHFHF
jgi:hypothetical protein